MRSKKVIVKHRQKKKVATFQLRLPESLEEALSAYGEEQVYQLVLAQVEKEARVTARNLLSYDHKPESVKERMEEEWTPSKRLKKKSPIDLGEYLKGSLKEEL